MKETKKIPIHEKIIRLVISIVIAITLWFTVNGDADLLIIQDYNSIPITISNSESLAAKNLVLAEDKSYYLNLKIKGTDRNLRNIDYKEIRAEVNLEEITQKGTYDLDIAVKGLPNTVIINSMNPTSLQIVVDNVIKEKHETVIKAEGKPANDQSVINIEVDQEVDVEGPEEELQRIDKIQGTVNVNGLEVDAVRYVQILAYDSDGDVIENVTLLPDVVKAEIILGQTKTVTISPSTSGLPKNGYIVTESSVEPAKVLIGAKKEVLDSIDWISVNPVNVSNQSQTFTRDVDLDLPEGSFYLDGNGKAKVTVTIETPIEKSITMNTIETKNLQSGLVVKKMKDTKAVIKLQGAGSVVNAVNVSQVEAFVDCSGLGPGEHELAIKTNLSAAIIQGISPMTTIITIGYV